ncbi:hypothetical protein FOCC_FOCC011022 [Frankliniella occidentalis]|nr:hypothetical protein FOCC_FOCC011022 [Frankliniella occidentalis]
MEIFAAELLFPRQSETWSQFDTREDQVHLRYHQYYTILSYLLFYIVDNILLGTYLICMIYK